MPIVAPTHSVKPNSPRVYHNQDRCTERNNIEAGSSRKGTGGRPSASTFPHSSYKVSRGLVSSEYPGGVELHGNTSLNAGKLRGLLCRADI